MKSRVWFCYDPEWGYETFDNEKDARAHANLAMVHATDSAADNGWREDENIHWGEMIVHQECRLISTTPAPQGSDFDTFEVRKLIDVKDDEGTP